MSDLITELTPLNLLEEKEKFLADPTHSYNPQLKYVRQFSHEELTAWGFPEESFMEHSVEVLKDYTYDDEKQKDYIQQEEVIAGINEFNAHYQIFPPVLAEFSFNTVARCRVADRKMIFQLPLLYTHESFADLCRHELETHILRRYNHKLTDWTNILADNKDEDFRSTEEGLANLHTHLYRKDRIIWKTYLSYVSVGLAQKYSFAQVFAELKKYGFSDLRAWSTALRTKRGVEDTEQPGGLTKDITYLHGTVSVWDWIINQKNDPHLLYIGRLGLDQIEKYAPAVDKNKLIYPRFFDNMEEYLANVSEIGTSNRFDQLTK